MNRKKFKQQLKDPCSMMKGGKNEEYILNNMIGN
jgi:hypothetical protein